MERADIEGLRDLVLRYLELANHPDQESRREVWRRYHGFEEGPVPVVASAAGYFIWMKEYLRPRLVCRDEFLRSQESELRRRIFHGSIGDDTVFEPWITLPAAKDTGGRPVWGVECRQSWLAETNARRMEHPIKTWDDLGLVRAASHAIDEAKTARQLERLQDAVGDLIPIDVDRAPWCKRGFSADLSTDLCYLRGLGNVMLDMYENPEALHRLLAIMRDGVLAAQGAAEKAGDLSLSGFTPQHPMPFARDMEDPVPNSGPRNRADLWYYCAAQEFTLVSPAMHEEFMLRYQLPIMSAYRKVHYGCCENLTKKIDMLRKVPNLAIVSVTPSADLRSCAEQIGREYLISWRPNPTDMVSSSWDEERIARLTREAREAFRSGRFCVHLKDNETLGGDLRRLERWVALTRRLLD